MQRFALILALAAAAPLPAPAQSGSQLAFPAAYAGDGKVIGNGLVWRVFASTPRASPS